MDFERGEILGRPALVNKDGVRFSLIDNEHVSFGDVCRGLTHQQAQYGSRYVNAHFADQHPFIGQGLRIVGDPNDYHELGIHPDDIDEFVKRYGIARAYESGVVIEDGRTRVLSEQEKLETHNYLESIGAFTPSNSSDL